MRIGGFLRLFVISVFLTGRYKVLEGNKRFGELCDDINKVV